MSVLSIYSSYRNALPSSSGSVWPASNTDIATANAATISIGGTNRTLDTKDGYTYTGQGRLAIVVSSPIRLRLELWGAGGGGSDASQQTYGSSGGYIAGDLVLPNGNYWLITGQGGRAAHQSDAFPDGGEGSTNYSGGSSGGGGSTRFGPQSSYVSNTSAADSTGLNNSAAVYYLIAPGGGGGTDYGTYTNAARGGYGAGGGFASGDGRFAYNSGESEDSPACGAGQSYGGLTGTVGRQGDGDAGTKYQGGNGTGGGGGGGYYGGGGAKGYYAQGSGGSAYYDPDYVRNVMCIAGGHEGGVNQEYWRAPWGFRGKPSDPCGNGGLNDGSNGADGGARFSLWEP